ncbi:hypothetical protein BGZ61DRAFT_499977 [Ilyonectria robusta]|uniref:uncharacterized protein n=1 Tax=Ilyonectria robusta TaxID=1079257 RepID=UPI001E8DABA3|nr:uncharacterized protein BGZ61DRAFT_499977 [Ilyonectria robusta]KAH8658580.1 hypothetical protein BGZ61DRAFT_499977 [Ilyonectria robusta]
MRAWNFSTAGDPSSVLSFSASFPTPPSPTGSQLLVHISHAGLSSAGLNLMRQIPSSFRMNAVPEIDFSGRVVSAGPSVPARFSPGTAIFGTVSKSASVLSGVGVLAEYVLVKADCVAVKPVNMSFAEAAGLSGLGQTALEMIRRGEVKQGKRALINGGSGGVGMVAVQLVKALGGYVVATCSGQNVDTVKSLGADEVIDYASVESLPEHLARTYGSSQFDVILDTVGSQSLYKSSPKYLKAGSPFVNVGTTQDTSQAGSIWRWATNSNLPAMLGGVPRKYIMFSAPLSGKGAETLATFVEEGSLKIIIDSTFALEDVLEAYERGTSRKARGKVVIRIGDFDNENITY